MDRFTYELIGLCKVDSRAQQNRDMIARKLNIKGYNQASQPTSHIFYAQASVKVYTYYLIKKNTEVN